MERLNSRKSFDFNGRAALPNTGFAEAYYAHKRKRSREKSCLLQLRKLSFNKAKGPPSKAFQLRSIKARDFTKSN